MAKRLQIVQFFGDSEKILQRKCDPVTELTDDIKELIEDMICTVSSVGGIGLAAPQVGKSLQIIILDGKVLKEKEDWIVMINPKLDLLGDEKTKEEEYCLSFPRIGKMVERHYSVQITGHLKDWSRASIVSKGSGARLIQHEFDHLQGITLANQGGR
jgi:peptide deformylase